MQTDALNEAAERAAEFLRTVAHPGRLRIVCALMDGELSASQLARQARLPAPALSQQAAILEAEGMIGRRREGRSVVYRLLARATVAVKQRMTAATGASVPAAEWMVSNEKVAERHCGC